MLEEIVKAIDDFIEEIHTVDQKKLDAKFVIFLDEIEKLMVDLGERGYQVNLMAEMLELQKFYQKRDLVELSDYILYTFQPAILELEKLAR